MEAEGDFEFALGSGALLLREALFKFVGPGVQAEIRSGNGAIWVG